MFLVFLVFLSGNFLCFGGKNPILYGYLEGFIVHNLSTDGFDCFGMLGSVRGPHDEAEF